MVGFSYRIQIRHIVVEKKEVADLIKSAIDDLKDSTARIKMLMKLAPKYSICESKEDGGNLGWLELSCDDPRITDYQPVFKNVELEKIVRDAVKKMTLSQGKLFGPVKTREGFHIVLLCQQFGEENATTFTGSSV